MASDGIFSSQGTLSVNNTVQTDLSNYRFYAVGLYPGISIHNDLTVTGRADHTSTAWNSSTSMSIKVAVTDVTSGATEIIDSSIAYTFDSTNSGFTYDFTVGGTSRLNSGTLSGTALTLASGDALNLSVSNGTVATITYRTTGDNPTLTEGVLGKADSGSYNTDLDTSGSGTYTITFSKAGTTNSLTVTVTVIGKLVPLNSILITCSPVS